MCSVELPRSAAGLLAPFGSFRNLITCRKEAMVINMRIESKVEEASVGRNRPEEELLSSFLFDDVQLVVVPQCTGHFLIRHVISVLLNNTMKCKHSHSDFAVAVMIWQTTQARRCSPFGSPRDVPDRWGRPP